MIGTWLGYYKFDSERGQKLIGFDKTNFTLIINSFDGKNFRGTVNDDIETGGMKETGNIIGHINNENIFFKKFMPKLTVFYNDGTRETLDKKHLTLYYYGRISKDKKQYIGYWKFKVTIIFLYGFFPLPYRPGRGTWSMTLSNEK